MTEHSFILKGMIIIPMPIASYTRDFKKNGIKKKLSLYFSKKEWKMIEKFCKRDLLHPKSLATGIESIVRDFLGAE